MVEIRKIYDKHPRCETVLVGPSLTKQSPKDDCDINNIIAKALRAGGLPEAPEGLYGDFSSVPDYMTAMDTMNRAREQFELLPAKLRKRLNNDPAEFLAFVEDKENLDELTKYGLVQQKNSGANAPSIEKGDKARVEASASTGQPAVGEGPKS